MELFPIVDLQRQIRQKADAADRGQPDGLAPLDSAGKVPLSSLPADLTSLVAGAELTTRKNQAHGYAGLDALGKVGTGQIPTDLTGLPARVTTAEQKLVPGGGSTGQVLAKQSGAANDVAWVNQSGGGGTVTWSNISGKPAVIGAGSTAAAARTAIDAAEAAKTPLIVNRDGTSPYAWPSRPVTTQQVLWVDNTEQSPLDPAGYLAGDLIFDSAFMDLKGPKGDKGDKGDTGATGTGVPTTGNNPGDLLRWNGSVWIQTATKFHEGTGNPNGVISAPVGSTFVNTETGGFNGARRWTKATGTGNTGWVVVDGDTGLMSLKDNLVNGWAHSQTHPTNMTLQRVNNTVTLTVNSSLLGGSATSAIFLDPLPVGFRIHRTTEAQTIYLPLIRSGTTTPSAATYLFGGSRAYLQATIGQNHHGIAPWNTQEAWPAANPYPSI